MSEEANSSISERDHARKRFEDAVNNLHNIFQGFDDRVARKNRVGWECELDVGTVCVQGLNDPAVDIGNSQVPFEDAANRAGDQCGVLVLNVKVVKRS